MKISTGTGDRGMTGLLGGQRVAKNHRRIETNGDLDELNAVLGMLATALAGGHDECIAEITAVQTHLLTIGARVAVSPGAAAAGTGTISEIPLNSLEAAMVRMEKQLPPLTGFIIPGGHAAAVHAHLARTVCRRAERRVVGLLAEMESDPVQTPLMDDIRYLNRLSDFLFILARYCNWRLKIPERLWQS